MQVQKALAWSNDCSGIGLHSHLLLHSSLPCHGSETMERGYGRKDEHPALMIIITSGMINCECSLLNYEPVPRKHMPFSESTTKLYIIGLWTRKQIPLLCIVPMRFHCTTVKLLAQSLFMVCCVSPHWLIFICICRSNAVLLIWYNNTLKFKVTI